MNQEIIQFVNPFMKKLSSKVDKSIFVGTIIQVIGACRINQCSGSDAFDLFQYILYETDFDETTKHDYLTTYVNQLNNKKREKFCIDEFEKVIFNMICESKMDYYEAVARADEEEYEEKEFVTLSEISNLADEAEYKEQEMFQTYYSNKYSEEDSTEDTGILDSNFWNNESTIAMAENLQMGYGTALSSRKIPFLIKENTGEKILINKDMFSIGKDATMVDYTIIGNTTVSRKHAEIIKKGIHFFLCDKSSTNKTYVEGREIRPEEYVEIHNGTKFKLSNEEFIFYF